MAAAAITDKNKTGHKGKSEESDLECSLLAAINLCEFRLLAAARVAAAIITIAVIRCVTSWA
jgi:hypothetical protein